MISVLESCNASPPGRKQSSAGPLISIDKGKTVSRGKRCIEFARAQTSGSFSQPGFMGAPYGEREREIYLPLFVLL